MSAAEESLLYKEHGKWKRRLGFRRLSTWSTLNGSRGYRGERRWKSDPPLTRLLRPAVYIFLRMYLSHSTYRNAPFFFLNASYYHFTLLNPKATVNQFSLRGLIYVGLCELHIVYSPITYLTNVAKEKRVKFPAPIFFNASRKIHLAANRKSDLLRM